MVDAADLKSAGLWPYGFESRPEYDAAARACERAVRRRQAPAVINARYAA